jgi:predicted SnoaL-like aldol condensation-catalyzing enzyme
VRPAGRSLTVVTAPVILGIIESTLHQQGDAMQFDNRRGSRPRAAMCAIVLALGAASTAFAADPATEANKKLAVDFFNLVLVQKKPQEGFDKYAGKTYIQHNPVAGDGHAPAIKFLSDWFAKNPKAIIQIKRVIAEGDLVAIHHHMRTSPDVRGMAAVDIFRVENGKVVEHWDVVQPMPEKSANDHPMF